MKKCIQLIMVLMWMGVTYADELSSYDFEWLDPDKEVYVLQNRKYRKKGSPYFNIGFGPTTSAEMTNGYNLQGRAGFFFREDWGIEMLYSKNSFSENATARSVKSAGAVPFVRSVDSYFGGLLMWSPFYAKINTFNKIVYVDWFLGLGFANVSEENNKVGFDAGTTGAALATESHAGFIWDTGLKFYINQQFFIRTDFLGIYYKARSANFQAAAANEILNSHYDLSFGVGMQF